MSCIKGPSLPVPELPFPLTLGGSVSVSASTPGIDYCCKLPPVSIPIPPIPLSVVILNPAVIAAMKAYISMMTAYVNSIPLECPLE